MTEKPLGAEGVEEPQLFEDDLVAKVAQEVKDQQHPEEKHAALLEDNQRLINELVGIDGQAAIGPLQVALLDLRLQVTQELVFRALGDSFRFPFAIQYEALANEWLNGAVSAAKRRSLAL